MTPNTSFPLTTLLSSSPFLLAYSIPLLLISLLLTFAGTFLTLDRTRSFPPHYDVVPGAFSRKKRISYVLQGGIGGLAIGFLFGVHLSTFLALLIPALTRNPPLTPTTFLVVWLLSAVVTTPLGGRWKVCAVGFAGIQGGVLFALGLSVMIHPSLLTRLVFTVIIAPVLTVLTLLPLQRFQHAALRFATASTGAFGAVVSIALISGNPAWADVWERYWVKDGGSWGSRKEQGLTAAFALLLAFGIVADWLLRRKFGECPDEKWDSYLASYATNLPDRAGSYQPFVPFWSRVFGGDKPVHSTKDIVFPPQDRDAKFPPFSPDDDDDSYFQRTPGFLMKAKKGKRSKEGVKFKPGEMSSDSESDDDMVPARPWLARPGRPGRPGLRAQTSMSSTTPTLVDNDVPEIDYDTEIKKLKSRSGLGDGEVPEYSDYEEDVTTARPLGLKQQRPLGLKTALPALRSSQTTAVPPSPPLGAVPATPSLIKALDRIAVAQKEVFGDAPRSPGGDSGKSPGREGPTSPSREARWDGFWKDVGVKAGSPLTKTTTTTKDS
ncbi:hypothetical protein C8J56DRAFT_969013 [Mycena floridula]|nr:hypothetical protein C8J56DRAFT_969013 [Mycena floridula]